MRLHVELTKEISRAKCYKPFAFWLAARHCFPCGRFCLSKRSLDLFSSMLMRDPKTVRRYLKFALAEKLLRPPSSQGFYYIENYRRIYERFRIRSKSAFDFNISDLTALKEVFFAVNLEHYILWRTHRQGKGNHGIARFQSRKKGDTLTYSPSMLSVGYLAKMFKRSRATVQTWKAKGVKRSDFQIKRTRIDLMRQDRRYIKGLRECSEFGHKICFDGQKYILNHSDSFKHNSKTRFFSWKLSQRM